MKEGDNFYITTRARKQRMDASKSYQELNREVKRSQEGQQGVCESEAKRAEEVGKRGDMRTL